MIFGLGNDIVEVLRIKEKLEKNNGFKELVFSVQEIAICEKKAKPYESYAARFAAKEALLKALGCGLQGTFELHHIEILSMPNGQPFIRITDDLTKLLTEITGTPHPKLHLSLSHTTQYAIASVLVEITEN